MPTPNYGWITPVVGGDLGAWGTIENTLSTAVDSQVFTVQTQANLGVTNAATAQSAAVAAQSSATSANTKVDAKILISTAAPTGSDVAPDGTLWCQV